MIETIQSKFFMFINETELESYHKSIIFVLK